MSGKCPVTFTSSVSVTEGLNEKKTSEFQRLVMITEMVEDDSTRNCTLKL